MTLTRRILALCCALAMTACMLPDGVLAEEDPASPTDLAPLELPEPAEPVPEEPEHPEPVEGEGSGNSVEVLITKALKPGEAWSGNVTAEKPAVLKLDLKYPQTVYMLLEGRNLWATVLKADAQAQDAPMERTDPETERAVVSWSAEAGAYLIHVGTDEESQPEQACVTFMDQAAYEAWEAENTAEEEQEETPEEQEEGAEETTEEAGNEPEEEPAEEPAESETEEPDGETEGEPAEETPDGETEGEPEEETEEEPEEEPEEPKEENPEGEPEEEQPEPTAAERSITVEVTWDKPDPVIGDTAHFKANLEGYDNLAYTMQWQYSEDRNQWVDIPNATEETMDVVVTEENNLVYWRIIVYVEEAQEE